MQLLCWSPSGEAPSKCPGTDGVHYTASSLRAEAAFLNAVRTTVDIPEPLYDRLRHRAKRSGASIHSLIVRAIEQVYSEPKKGDYVTGPLVAGQGKLGPAFPEKENPHDLVFSRT